jgi:hypothetical protein
MKLTIPTLRPAEGRRVRHPDGSLFAAEGERVVLTPYYRRLRDAGDLEPVPTEKKSASKGSSR